MYLYRLSNALARRGHLVSVIHCVDSYRLLTSAGPRGDFPHHPNVTIHPLSFRPAWLSPLVSYLTGQPGLKSRALRKILAKNRYDVVHFHLVTLFGPGVLSYGGDALRVYTTHDHWLVCPMYDLWKNNRELCETPTCLRCSLSYKRPPQLWRYSKLLRHELPRVDLFLSPSRATIEQHHRRGFPYPIQHLPHFLPIAESALQQTVPSSDRPYFLFVGRLVKLKGLQTLIEAFRHYPQADLVVAGDGPLGSELRRLAEGMEQVRFLGRVHPDRLQGLYRGAIAVLMSSLVYETFGFVTLEALGQQTPVIGRDLGAVGELVRDTGGGLTYRTEKELLEAMQYLQMNPSVRERLGRQGHAACLQRYSEEAHIETYLAAIQQAEIHRRRLRAVTT